ncbi:NAD(P)H-hydrate dehydratase [Candidatus Uabimicrobium amorphum]|uniref:ADP-dependent (S)-NAD(P)H-hydrate dehydratase n=1 Tax=Uabimicrobium amorphum TaxID=2596890 RepID=A0A5S9ILS7_UABAM|nr:NAD(P)H-hydrate dehydratase [Candidatus Uabimicrobium amorphum]BBM84074.1 bifunctional NAD(P)H-hydrate repair enzyme Nnr [Candidatus Uabimicrobium amorphum]
MEQIQTLPKLSPRKQNAHKGSCGKVFIIAGSRGMMGAAYLTTESVLRSGAGLVTLATPDSEQRVAATKLTCAMTYPLPSTSTGAVSFMARSNIVDVTNECQAVAIGPGMSQHHYTQEFIYDVIPRLRAPIVIDADALNALCDRSDVLKKRSAPTIVTPHPGEFSRLVGKPINEIVENGKEIAMQFARDHNCVVVLKVAPAIVVSHDSYYENTTGNPGMATGGSGDVLTGVITALLAQGFSAFAAAQLGVYLHGAAGDLCKEYIGEYGMIASDILQFLPHAFQIHLSQE